MSATSTDKPNNAQNENNYSDPTIRIENSTKQIMVITNQQVIADSRNTLIVHEANYAPVYYFPRSDVHMELMKKTDHTSHCPHKGTANYWSLQIGNQLLENLLWSYESPQQKVQQIAGYMAFYQDKVDLVFSD